MESENNSTLNHHNNYQLCPHLGLSSDGETCYRYPSVQNYCHFVKDLHPVALKHQVSVCLTTQYEICPVLESGSRTMPRNLKAKLESVNSGHSILQNWWVYVILILLVLLLLFVVFSGKEPKPVGTTVVNPAVTQTPEILSEEEAEPEEIESTPEADEDQPVTLENTAVPAAIFQGSAVATPIGPDQEYVVHQVQVNESLGAVANKYHTSRETIQFVNGMVEGTVLWVNDVLVVPWQDFEPVELQVLRAVYVDSFHTVQDFAKENQVAESVLREINGISADYEILYPCQWLLILNEGTQDFHAKLTPTPIFDGSNQSAVLGTDGEYLLHQVSFKEDLQTISERYGTNVAVITKMNGLNADSALVMGQVLVIRPNFRLYSLAERIYLFHVVSQMKATELLDKMGWHVEAFAAYNGIEDIQEVSLQNQWVIYPAN